MSDDIDVLKGGVALLAFILAFYGLAAKERKAPYITDSVYSSVILIIGIIIIDLFSKIYAPVYPKLGSALSLTAQSLFIISLLFVLYRIWKIYNRLINFRDDHLIRNLACIRYIRSVWRQIVPKQRYEYSTIGITPELVKSIINTKHFAEEEVQKAVDRNSPDEKKKLSLSAIYKTTTWSDVDDVSIDLITSFLDNNAYVQYATCSRHPIEFILRLHKAWGSGQKSKRWDEIQNNIIAVDAYTPHYGFADTAHIEWTKAIRELGIECIMSHASYAGLHTSAAKAFNIIKKRHEKNVRYPTLVIYEGAYGLVDLESVEQYRIFIRHVLPSEKIWGGMFTLFTETVIPDDELNLIKSYADMSSSK